MVCIVSLEFQAGDTLSGGKNKDYFSCGLGKDKVADFNQAEGDGKSYNCES